MSEKSTAELEVLAKKKKAQWWMQKKRLKIFNLLTKGKTFDQIMEAANLSQAFYLERIITNPFFLERLQDYLSRVFFNFQVNKILSMEEVLKLYWDIITGKTIDKELSKDQASKHYLKLLMLKDRDPQVINPKQYNLILNLFKTGSPEQLKSFAKEFGFEGLQVPDGEGPIPGGNGPVPKILNLETNEGPSPDPRLDPEK